MDFWNTSEEPLEETTNIVSEEHSKFITLSWKNEQKTHGDKVSDFRVFVFNYYCQLLNDKSLNQLIRLLNTNLIRAFFQLRPFLRRKESRDVVVAKEWSNEIERGKKCKY